MAALFKNTLPISLLFIVEFLMSYGWSLLPNDIPFRSLLGSALIIFIAWVAWPGQWKERLGLRIPRRAALSALALTPLLMLLIYLLIQGITKAAQISYHHPAIERGLFSRSYDHALGQTLNEELVFGALLLFSFSPRLRGSHPLRLTAGIALVFVGLHYVFYRWVVSPDYAAVLTWGTLFVLFAIGMLRNTLTLKSGHIAYAWALHLSINLVGLVADYRFADGAYLGEGQMFNLILGAPAAAAAAALILAGCMMVLRRPPAGE